MFTPISKLDYLLLDPNAQALVVACPLEVKVPEIRKHWASRAAASLGDSSMFLPDLVRDLLANPHIRIVVFHGEACGRAAYDSFWRGTDDPGWGIDLDHLNRIRQFVDLYDGDFNIKGPMPPHWPTRVRYFKKETS